MGTSLENPRRVHFEAVLKPEDPARSLYAPEAVITAESLEQFSTPPGAGRQAAQELRRIGFTIRHVGTYSISGEGPKGLWEKTFSTRVEERTATVIESHRRGDAPVEARYLSHVEDTPFTVPDRLAPFIERAYPQRPPLLMESPLPPRVGYHHLRVPGDVALILRARPVHEAGLTGRGTLVAMPDTGFYKHPFYAWNGYNYNATLAPDATKVGEDDFGHGTAEAANVFAAAPDVDFIGVKMGPNATLAFKTGSDLQPAVMTNSWGFHLPGLNVLPNFLKPLEAAVIEAVRGRGITVCFSAGNGHIAFPAMMPEALAVGGVFAHEGLNAAGDDFELEASNYASSFDSLIYPGRHVPDVCGLVGMKPQAIYIMLPVQPKCTIDTALGGPGFPAKDETKTNDGWSVISGTSAASPQVAGVCALLRQARPGLSPDLVKSILKASARDVTQGSSQHQPAGEGHDGATGAGLVDAYAAYKLARSVQIRNIFDLPAPR